MAASEALSVSGESTPTPVDPTAAAPTTTVPGPAVASQRWPQLLPIAQLVAIVAGVLGIIWSQQTSIDNLRAELTADINRVETTLRAEFSAEIGGLRTELSAEIDGLRTEIGGLRTELSAEIDGLRAEVAENSQRLARIEGHLGIGIPDDPPQ